jgi:hypothetical protein
MTPKKSPGRFAGRALLVCYFGFRFLNIIVAGGSALALVAWYITEAEPARQSEYNLNAVDSLS